MVIAIKFETAAQFEVSTDKSYLILLRHVAEAFLDVRACRDIKPVVVVLYTDRQTQVVAIEEFGMMLRSAAVGRITRIHEAELVIEADEQRPVVVKTELGVGAQGTHEVVDAGGRNALGEAAPAASGVGDERNRLPAILCGSEKRQGNCQDDEDRYFFHCVCYLIICFACLDKVPLLALIASEPINTWII